MNEVGFRSADGAIISVNPTPVIGLLLPVFVLANRAATQMRSAPDDRDQRSLLAIITWHITSSPRGLARTFHSSPMPTARTGAPSTTSHVGAGRKRMIEQDRRAAR
jgi:hypothetical protein